MTKEELSKIFERHLHWIRKDCKEWENMRADLSRANLSGADLSRANLFGADLSRANLSGANLSRANLSGADLSGAYLSRADLSGAYLFGADLSGAYLSRANLAGADLSRANLAGAKIENSLINKYYPLCCPEYGAFIGWKKANGYIIKLQITDDAKRSSAFGRKCRCSKALVIAIENPDGSDSGINEIASDYDMKYMYRIGETVEVDNFDCDRKKEYAPGIHFFITRQEAVNY